MCKFVLNKHHVIVPFDVCLLGCVLSGVGMRKIGSGFEYEYERDKDLLRAYREAMSFRDNSVSIYHKIVSMPSRRFWVSEERATVVITKMIKHGVHSISRMQPKKQEMFIEIYRRVSLMRRQRPTDSIYNIVFDVVNQQAPEFYLTSGSAKVILHRIVHKCRQRGVKSISSL